MPMKVMGLLVAATAERAPPPLAWPSSLVMMTWPTCWAEITNRTNSDRIAAWSGSYVCVPSQNDTKSGPNSESNRLTSTVSWGPT